MRLENKEEYEGRFWFPKLINRIGNGKGQKIGEIYPSLQEIAGHLTIETDGSASLSLNFPSWSAGSKAFDRFWDMHNRGIHDLSRIHGIVDNKFVILLDCQENSYSRVMNRLGTNIKKYSPRFCIIRNQFTPLLKKDLIQGEGKDFKQAIKEKYPEVEDFNDGAKIDFDDVTDIGFDTLQFYFDGIRNFFQITGFNDLIDDEDDRLASRTGAKIEWKKSVPLPIYSSENFTLKVENLIDWHKNPTHDSEERKIKEYTRCVLEFPEPLPLEKCVKMIEQIKSFFAFIFNCRIGITHLSGALREKKFAASSPKGKIYKHPILHNIHYQNDDWDATQPPKDGYVPIGYKNFEESNGDSNLFGEYLSSCVAKMKSDAWFSDYFDSHLLSLSPLPLTDQFTRRIQNFEYLFQKCMVPKKTKKRKGIKNLATKLKILINEAGLPYNEDLTEKIKSHFDKAGLPRNQKLSEKIDTLNKSNSSYKDAEFYGLLIAEMRGSIVHVEKDVVNYDLLRDIWRWLGKFEKFYFLSMIYENDELNKEIIERIFAA